MLNVYILCFEVLIPTLFASIYGFAVVMRRHKGLYFSMGVLAVVCQFIGQLAFFLSLYTGNESTSEFNIGMLGSVGACLFFLTANMGSVNMLLDIEPSKILKFKILAWLGPILLAVIFGVCVLIMHSTDNYEGAAASAILTAVTMFPMYFSTRAAIVPDVKNGFFDCMRPFNIFVIVLMALFTLERSARNLWEASGAAAVLCYVFYGVTGLCVIAVMIFLERGARKWKSI